MIIDKIENMSHYFTSPSWKKTVEYIKSMDIDCAEGEYQIEGSQFLARVMSYFTKPRSDATLEAHEQFVDVHILLTGHEIIEWTDKKKLSIQKPYDAKGDAAIYIHPQQSDGVFSLATGYFALFLPQDAHLTQIKSDEAPTKVKKVVFKIARNLLF